MSIKVSDRLRAPSRGSLADAKRFFDRYPPRRRDEAEACVAETYRLCPLVGLDAAVAVARMGDETGDREGPAVFVSDVWANRLNAGGLGVTDGGDLGYGFANGVAAARAVVVHLARYAIPPDDDAWEVLRPYVGLDPRFDAVPPAWRGTVSTLADLQGKWFSLPQGATNSAARGNAIFPGIPDQTGGPMPETPRRRPVVVIDAGHRSTDRSGNDAEEALTDDMAVAYVDELRRRGYQADWYQRDLDRDSDPDDTIGTLNTVAKGLGAWLKGQEWALLVSCHYNGGHSPVHVIVPDNIGLATAYPEGRDPNDTAANNPLDVELARTIARRMVDAGLGSMYGGGRLGIPGVMSERDTGVGLDGFRLALMSATCPSRQTAVRLVVEHGGTADPHARNFPAWAKAAADAIDEVYGLDEDELPEPEPIWPTKAIPAPDEVRAQGHTLTPLTPRRRKATQGTTRRTAPHRDAPAATQTPIRAGRTYSWDYEAEVFGERWFVSRLGSWALASAFEEAA